MDATKDVLNQLPMEFQSAKIIRNWRRNNWDKNIKNVKNKKPGGNRRGSNT